MTTGSLIHVAHVVRGHVVGGCEVVHRASDGGFGFTTPALDVGQLVWLRSEPLPAQSIPMPEVLDFLVETGRRLDMDSNPAWAEAVGLVAQVNPLSRRVIENIYRSVGSMFQRELLEFELEQNLGMRPEEMDQWREVTAPDGTVSRIRPFPPRILTVMAGNNPGVAAQAIIRGCLSRAVSLLKLPSNDLFSATAILRTMASIEADHPLVRSFSAAYWPGGDEAVEKLLFHPQYFDRVMAWGGESAIANVVRYLGPGIELVSFDPKVSISMIGHEAFADTESLVEAAELAASDATVTSQESCGSSRYQFVEGEPDQVDRFCDMLAQYLSKERPSCDAVYRITPDEIRDEVDGLRLLDPLYRVFGDYDGSGLVVRSPEPVDFYPEAKTVNVVSVRRLEDAMQYVNMATQTVGVYPHSRKIELRDLLGGLGVQRVVTLGSASRTGAGLGLPHDAMYPLHRLVRWVVDEG